MSELIQEIAIGALAAVLIMIVHELAKSLVYVFVRVDRKDWNISFREIFKVWRYIDPAGLILSVTCYCPVSRPYMFRVRDKKTNMLLGLCGFIVNLVMLACSFIMVKLGYSSIFWQYMALLSFDYLVINLFPVSTFDMGLIIAGYSARHYLQLIKMDSVIKLILMLALLLDVIHYGGARILSILFAL